ncbi:hypothetical protein NDU88_003908 [Pleurodeles waltl]|uniref:Uncharacterized protein n=1 Tax=Pleurodeles waltl TaxID=8319 RepID=A0AAV7MT99_PLEWA|nr:hypothetical protein NDU88_003908 [Pleurodeles waltl]
MAEERAGQVERSVRAPLATRYNKVLRPAGDAPFYGRGEGGPSGEKRPCSTGNPLQQSPASRRGAPFYGRGEGGPSGEKRPCSPGNPLQQSPMIVKERSWGSAAAVRARGLVSVVHRWQLKDPSVKKMCLWTDLLPKIILSTVAASLRKSLTQVSPSVPVTMPASIKSTTSVMMTTSLDGKNHDVNTVVLDSITDALVDKDSIWGSFFNEPFGGPADGPVNYPSTVAKGTIFISGNGIPMPVLQDISKVSPLPPVFLLEK